MAEAKNKVYTDADDSCLHYFSKPSQAEPWGDTSIVGGSRPRVDGYERVSGSAVYPSDVVLPHMLFAAVLSCPHPHAKLEKLDDAKARKTDGVRALLSVNDPEADIEWPYDKDMKAPLFPVESLYEGEIVAAAAAESPDQAHDALRAIDLAWEVLDFVADERDALAADAPKVHSKGNKVSDTSTYERGDLEAGFAEADVVLEREYRTKCLMHTPIERHGCVAAWEGDTLTIWESTQGVYSVQKEVADVLQMELSKVRVIGHYVGGGFGSKLSTGKYAVIAALLARKTGRPVKLFLTREETFLTMGNRPASTMTLKAGVKKDGALTALHFTGLGASGAYPAGGVSLLDWVAKDMYRCPNVKTELTDVFINAGLTRPFRAPGYPQGAWAVEQMMDELAEEIGMDPVQIRLQNYIDISQGREGKPPYTTNGLRECINEGAAAFGWEEKRKSAREQPADAAVRRGAGMAACQWFVGGGWPPATVVIKLFEDGSVNLNTGASDIGTGTKTVLAMIAAEELGVDPDAIQIEHADTGTTQYASASGGSKTLPTEGPATRAAAIDVRNQLLEMAAAELDAEPCDLVLEKGKVQVAGAPDKAVPITKLKGLSQQKVVMGVGHKQPNPEDKTVCPFGAQYCEVEVNTRTGEVSILRFVAAHESGKVIDRLTFDNQVIGGVTMGIGLGATEMRVLDRNGTGKLCNKNWHDYKLPTALDVAVQTDSLAIDMPDYEANISGAKGLGEPVTVPTAAALANAVYDAVGIRLRETPINPLQLASALAAKREES